MQTNQQPNQHCNRQRLSSHPLLLAGLVIGLLAVAACQPIRDPAVVAAEQTAVALGTPVAAVAATPEAAAADDVSGVEAAMATISTDSLRVRALPSDDAEVVAGVEEGEVFPVTGISSDGAWVQISIEEAPDGLGWVSAEFVTLAGDITNIEIVEVATEEDPGDATEDATEDATGEDAEEATAEVTEEAVEETTGETTPEPTAEATEEMTEEATAEATEEATEESTEGGIGSVIEETTGEATPEATEEASEETATSDLGTVTIAADPPLRVRSEPNADTEDNKIGNVFEGEVYTVLEISEDGLWVLIEVPELGDGTGWVSAEFVIFNEEE